MAAAPGRDPAGGEARAAPTQPSSAPPTPAAAACPRPAAAEPSTSASDNAHSKASPSPAPKWSAAWFHELGYKGGVGPDTARLARVTFGWAGPLIRRGAEGDLEDERAALPFVPRAHDAAVSVPRFAAAYARMSARGKTGALQRALWAVHWQAAAQQSAWALTEVAARVGQAVVLRAYLEWLTAAEGDRAGGEAWHGWALAGCISATSAAYMLIHHQLFW